MDLPPIRYAQASDGTRIAFTRVPGKSPPWLHVYSLGAPTIELDFSIGSRIASVQNLARGRATILYDPRGSGTSGPINPGLAVDDLADDLAAVTRAAGEPVDVSAMGTGCFVALAYAARGGEGWRSLVLQGPRLRYRGSLHDAYHAVRQALSYREFLMMVLRTTMHVPPAECERHVGRWAELVPEASAAAYIRTVAAEDFTERARAVRLPTLVLGAAPHLQASAEVAAEIPGVAYAQLSAPVNDGTLGDDVRSAWDAHIGRRLGEHVPVEGEGHLSAREVEVLCLVARGRTNLQIAAELGVSLSTVTSHVRHIFEKLHCSNRADAAAWAARRGIGGAGDHTNGG